MDNLGPCPLCGERCDQTERGCACTSCHYCLASSLDNHNRLSAMGELWRLLEFAGRHKLFIVPSVGFCDAFIWEEVPTTDNWPKLSLVSWQENTLDALREAKKKMEEKYET